MSSYGSKEAHRRISGAWSLEESRTEVSLFLFCEHGIISPGQPEFWQSWEQGHSMDFHLIPATEKRSETKINIWLKYESSFSQLILSKGSFPLFLCKCNSQLTNYSICFSGVASSTHGEGLNIWNKSLQLKNLGSTYPKIKQAFYKEAENNVCISRSVT